MDLTQEEIGLLRQLKGGPRIISGNGQRSGLIRLVTVGCVSEHMLNVSDTEYEITGAERATLASEASDVSISVEDLNASDDE